MENIQLSSIFLCFMVLCILICAQSAEYKNDLLIPVLGAIIEANRAVCTCIKNQINKTGLYMLE